MDKFVKILAPGAVCIFLFFVVLSTSVDASTTRLRSSKQRSGFGEICNKTIRCKSQSWLGCDPETERCGCAKPDEMIYDMAREKCVALVGERCKYGFGSDENLGSFYEKTDCVMGAACGTDGICICPNGTYEVIDENKCLPVKFHGAGCLSDVECDQSNSLCCLERKCQCASDDMIYDELEGLCKVKAGKSCVLPNKGVSDLTSSTEEPGVHVVNCVNGSNCILSSGMCTCRTGMYTNLETGRCLPVKGKGSHCNVSEECDIQQALSCVNRRCDCNPLKAVFTTETYSAAYRQNQQHSYAIPKGICVNKVDSACKEPEFVSNEYDYNTYDPNYGQYARRPSPAPAIGGRYCTKNALCSYGSCICSDGYTPTKDGHCGVGYGAGCSLSNVCSDTLRCISGTDTATVCKCPNEGLQVYEDGKCKGYIGGPCDPGQTQSCVKNAVCVDSEDAEGVSLCECKAGYIESGETKCEVAHDNLCGTTYDRCDSIAGLKCLLKSNNELRCSCPNQQDVFEKDLRKCSRGIGLRCDNDINCVKNAICDKEWEKASGRCRCKSGFEYERRSGLCVPEVAQDFSTNVDENESEGDLVTENVAEVTGQELLSGQTNLY